MRLLSLAAIAIGSTSIMSTLAQAAEIRAFVTGAARPAFTELVPRFERSTGHKVIAEFGLPPALVKRADAGEPFDVLILSYDIEPLIKQGKLASGTRTVLGRTGVGIAIPQGAPKPKFGNADELKGSLLAAKFIATSGEGSSGRYVLTLLDRLGIADQVKPKIKSGASGAAAKLLAGREVDFAVIGLPPVTNVPGVEWLGYLPDNLNSWLPFTGGVNPKAKEPAAARDLLKFLTTPEAVSVFKAKGLEPAS
ncbi:MAG: ABC transporter substrate-binding protein [Alphaproteobacteria bacterium]|nr:ABC transporter substrate-binding protein [Alphaproteobacteria bacterium]